jgi:hypothetical protein
MNENDQDKNPGAAILGILLIAIPIIANYLGVFKADSIAEFEKNKAIFVSITLIVRIFASIYVYNLTKRQNRDTYSWTVFALIIPSIALIILSRLKKIEYKISLSDHLTKDENITILLKKANEFKSLAMFDDAISILKKIYEMDSDRKYLLEEIENIEKEKSNKNLSTGIRIEPQIDHYIKFETDKGTLTLVTQKANSFPEIGNKLLKENMPAPTGKYKFGFMWFVHINNGYVTSVSIS